MIATCGSRNWGQARPNERIWTSPALAGVSVARRSKGPVAVVYPTLRLGKSFAGHDWRGGAACQSLAMTCRLPSRLSTLSGAGPVVVQIVYLPRLDPVDPSLLVDERHRHMLRLSSSALPKYPYALPSISFARRCSRLSRSSLLRSPRRPWPTSARGTRLRNACTVPSILRRNRPDRCQPGAMLSVMIQLRPACCRSDFRGILQCLVRDSILSRIAPPGIPGWLSPYFVKSCAS